MRLLKYLFLSPILVISVFTACANMDAHREGDDGNTEVANLPEYRFTTFAGLGQRGFRDGQGREAFFNGLGGVAVDSEGNIFVVDNGNRCIRKITPDGEVTLFAGKPGQMGREIIDGPVDDATFHSPQDIAVGIDGDIFITEPGLGVVRKITADGLVKTLAGRPRELKHIDGPLSEARFFGIQGIAVDIKGNVYITDWLNHTIRKITHDGEVRTIAGIPGERGHIDGPSDVAKLDSPYGICVSSDMSIYFTERGHRTIRKIDPNGHVSTFVSDPGDGVEHRLGGPIGIAIDNSDSIFVANRARQNIIRVDSKGNAEVIAGRYRLEVGRMLTITRLGRDGVGVNALFEEPRWIAVGDDGILYIVDTGENLIRKGEPVR